MERLSLPAVTATIDVHRAEAAANGNASSDLIAFFASLFIYALSAQRNVGYWDTGEMDTVPYMLGIAHPPGYPLYTLLGWAWTHALPFGSVAFRMSMLSALAMSAAAWCIYRIVRDETGDATCGVLAACLFSVSSIAWSHATRAEPHALALLAFTATLLFLLRWYRSALPRDLYLAALCFGLGVAVHPIVLFMLPGIIVLIISRLHEIEYPPLWRALLIALVSCTIWYVYFPLRSAYVTAEHLDAAASLGVVGSAFWDYGHPLLAANFVALVTGSDVDLTGPLQFAAVSILIAGAIAAVFGMKRIGMVLCVAGSFGFACGFTDEVDRLRYILPSLAMIAVFAGFGFHAARATRVRALVTPVAVAAFFGLLLANRALFAQAGDDRAARDVDVVLAATPDDAILVSNWILAPPLAYASYVEGRAAQRTVVATWRPDIEDLVPGWAQRRPVYMVERHSGHVGIHQITR